MTSFAAIPPIRWSLSMLWASSAMLVFTVLDASSLGSWMVLLVAGAMPPAALLSLWNDGPPPTIAEVLRATEDRRR